MIADLQAVEHLAKSLALGHAGQQNGQIAGQGLFLAAQLLAVVALVVDAQRRQDAFGLFVQPHTDLMPLELGIAEGAQTLAQQADAAVIERHGRLPDGFGVVHMATHQRRIHKSPVHFFHIGNLVGTDTALVALGIEGEDGLATEIGVAQQEDVAEGMRAVPVGGPVMLLAEKVQQGGLKARVPALFHGRRAGFFLEVQVHLGEHEKQGWRLAGTMGRVLAVGGADPVVHGAGQILHLLVAGADAEQHAGQFVLFAIALEQVGHLAAQEKVLQRAFAFQLLVQVQDLEAGAIARKVQQVRVGEEVVRLFPHEDGDLRRQGRDHGTGQGGLASVLAQQGQAVFRTVGPQPGQQGHVDDAGLPRQQGLQRAVGLGRVAQGLQSLAKFEEKLLEFWLVVPDDAEKFRPIAQGQQGGQADGLRPVTLLQHLDARLGEKVAVEVFAQVFHVIGSDTAGAGRRLAGRLGQSLEGGAHGVGIGHLLVFAVGIIGIGQHADHVHLGEQAQPDGEVRRQPLRRRGGEAGHQPGGFLAAFGIDLGDEIRRPAAEVRQQIAAAVAGQSRDEVGFAGLAGAEDAHTHLAAGGLFALAEKAGGPAHLFLQRGAFAAHGLAIVGQPGGGMARLFRQTGAARCQLNVLFLHDDAPVCPSLVGGVHDAGIQPVAFVRGQGLQTDLQIPGRDEVAGIVRDGGDAEFPFAAFFPLAVADGHVLIVQHLGHVEGDVHLVGQTARGAGAGVFTGEGQ